MIKAIDSGIKNLIFSLFWWFVDPMEKERIFSQIKDAIDRSLDVNNPDKTIAPDAFEVLVNNQVFIKHAHAVPKLETVLINRIQKYVADCDYELSQPKVSLQIVSSATMAKRKAEIRCWFSQEDTEDAGQDTSTYQIKVVEGEGKGLSWAVNPGNTYQIGRSSSAHICLPFDNISKIQATLYFLSENQIFIVDEGSANGTFIDDEEEKIKGSRDIKVGSKMRFCQVEPIVLILLTK